MMNTIQHGDCIRQMQGMDAGSVDLVFADPPFNIGYDYDVYRDSLSAEKYLDWSRQWIGAVHQVLKPNGTFWLAIGDEFAAELKIESQKIGFHCRSWVIWYYTFGVNCSRKFTRSHAHLFHFVKNPDDFVFRADELENRIPSARQLVYNDNRANSRGRLPDDTWIARPADAVGEMTEDDPIVVDVSPRDDDRTWVLRPQDVDDGFQADQDTWYFPRVAGTFKERSGFHGCQMPEQLLGRIIRSCSEPGALVVDPFSGSGTTVAVAKKLGRRYLGFDLSQDYVRLGNERLDAIRVGDPLDGSPEPTMSAPKTSVARNKKQKKSGRSNANDREKAAIVEASDRQLQLTMEGVIRAFAATHAGYSADRVVADPELNAQFTNACQELGLVGEARTWNMLLFRLRKSGRLADVSTERSPQDRITWSDCDPYLYASEIAWKLILDNELATSLDEILCDPYLSAKFDAVAREFAPGFTAFQYRWGALKLRKESKDARVRAASLSPPSKLGKPIPFDKLALDQTPAVTGVYLLGDPNSQRAKLYLGETINLQGRLQQLCCDDRRELWSRHAHDAGIAPDSLSVWVRPIEADACEMLAWQRCLVQQYKPHLNLLNG